LAVLEGHIDEIFSCVPPHHWVAVPRGLHPLRPNVIVHVYCHRFHPPHSVTTPAALDRARCWRGAGAPSITRGTRSSPVPRTTRAGYGSVDCLAREVLSKVVFKQSAHARTHAGTTGPATSHLPGTSCSGTPLVSTSLIYSILHRHLHMGGHTRTRTRGVCLHVVYTLALRTSLCPAATARMLEQAPAPPFFYLRSAALRTWC
jgi:hypothetical protein